MSPPSTSNVSPPSTSNVSPPSTSTYHVVAPHVSNQLLVPSRSGRTRKPPARFLTKLVDSPKRRTSTRNRSSVNQKCPVISPIVETDDGNAPSHQARRASSRGNIVNPLMVLNNDDNNDDTVDSKDISATLHGVSEQNVLIHQSNKKKQNTDMKTTTISNFELATESEVNNEDTESISSRNSLSSTRSTSRQSTRNVAKATVVNTSERQARVNCRQSCPVSSSVIPIKKMVSETNASANMKRPRGRPRKTKVLPITTSEVGIIVAAPATSGVVSRRSCRRSKVTETCDLNSSVSSVESFASSVGCRRRRAGAATSPPSKRVKLSLATDTVRLESKVRYC